MTTAKDPIGKIESNSKELVASKGIIYLMFIGRNVKALDIAKEAMDKGFVKKLAVVYQYVSSLQEEGFIKQIEAKGGKGNPKIRTANPKPIIQTIGAAKHLVSGLFYSEDEYFLSEKESNELILVFEKIGFLTHYFPEYLSLSLNDVKRDIRELEWKKTLRYFLQFCIEIVVACHSEKDLHTGKMGNYKDLPPNFGKVLRRNEMVKNIVRDAIETEKISKQDLSYLINLTQKGQDDIYRVDSFLQSLYLNALSLTNPEAAHFIKTFIGRFEEQNQKRIKG